MPGTLYIVATPIGNLADASPRSIEVLRAADLVACEDTRTSRTLLARHGIATPVVALHAHNEAIRSKKLLEMLLQGKSIALVSDAGTPGVSDPGALLVAAAHREGLRVVPVPGPSAAIAAWSASGFAADRFQFIGFMPGTKDEDLDELEVPWPVILYEAPHRVRATLRRLLERFGPERELLIARELTKKFEEVARMKLGEAPAWLEGAHREQGEFVLVLGPGAAKSPALSAGHRIMKILLQKLPAGEAASLAAKITGLPRNALYKSSLKGPK
ncbi:MAG: 16S rRNA (cytidine(1402)-2'-O)-methyltransferase [Pseudomonadota bacterium]